MDWIQKTLGIFFMSKVNYCIEKHVPVKRANVEFKKPKWMDQYCVRKVKKKDVSRMEAFHVQPQPCRL